MLVGFRLAEGIGYLIIDFSRKAAVLSGDNGVQNYKMDVTDERLVAWDGRT